MLDLFSDTPPWQEPLAPGAVVLRRFARERAPALLQAIADVASQSPFRQMVTPGGYTMSVAMTNCGALGWTTDRHGYLYAPVDPVTDQTWPPMPAVFHELALAAAAAGGYPEFSPDACLINRYCPGAKLSLHQDKDEQDLRAPIVSVSLGLPAICFAFADSLLWNFSLSSGASIAGRFWALLLSACSAPRWVSA